MKFLGDKDSITIADGSTEIADRAEGAAPHVVSYHQRRKRIGASVLILRIVNVDKVHATACTCARFVSTGACSGYRGIA